MRWRRCHNSQSSFAARARCRSSARGSKVEITSLIRGKLSSHLSEKRTSPIERFKSKPRVIRSSIATSLRKYRFDESEVIRRTARDGFVFSIDLTISEMKTSSAPQTITRVWVSNSFVALAKSWFRNRSRQPTEHIDL